MALSNIREYRKLISKMKPCANGWELNVLNTLFNWNPPKISKSDKTLLKLIALAHLNSEEQNRLFKIIELEEN